MLIALELKDFAIVDNLRLELSQGFNVLTGETGAGKSILIDALTLLTGGRADSTMIRSGAEAALVQIEFSPKSHSQTISRRLKRNGRGTARLDGEIVKVAEIAAASSKLIVIHGQHASQTLLSNSEQRKLLDKLLGSDAKSLLEAYQKTYARYQKGLKDLEALNNAARERAQRLDILKYQIEEIDNAKLVVGEEKGLQERAESLRYAERIVEGVGGASGLLAENEENALNFLSLAQKHLGMAARYNKNIETLASDLVDATASVQAICDELSSFLADFEVEPGELEDVQRRLNNIENLKLRYGEDIKAILSYRAKAFAELEELRHVDENIEELKKELKSLYAELKRQAASLSQARRKAGLELSTQVTEQIRPLGMKNAEFTVDIKVTESFTAYGKDKITFLFSANLGEPPAPLASVASGGELSRVMLGLNVVTGSDLPTLTFDEVDAGIGGQAARSVGALLKQLASNHQVLAVTHLAQVAAYANAHFYVEKIEEKGRTTTRISYLQGEAREAELARMLSGTVTEKALEHARELLKEADF